MRHFSTTLGLILLATTPLHAQINITVPTPSVPGHKIEVVSCPGFDSLLPPTKRKLKTPVFLAELLSDSALLYTSEPLTASNAQMWAFHYLWASARVRLDSLHTLPATVQLAMWAWAIPIITTETPPHPHLLATVDGGDSVDLGELRPDPGHQVRFSDPAKYPADGQVVYINAPSQALLRLLAARKAKLTWPGGWFQLSNEQWAGIAKVLMAAVCGPTALGADP